jgi:PilZ domain
MTSPGAPPPEAHGDERRRHTRTGISVPAELAPPDGPALAGQATGVGFGGALFLPDRPGPLPDVGAEVTLTLAPQGVEGPIVFACRVAHRPAEGLGLRFLATDPAGFERFADLMLRTAEAPGRLVEEMRVSPGFAVATDEGLRRALD